MGVKKPPRMKTCPKCSALSPNSVQKCVCGHVFFEKRDRRRKVWVRPDGGILGL